MKCAKSRFCTFLTSAIASSNSVLFLSTT